jgi:Flp pilus assembly protein TadD
MKQEPLIFTFNVKDFNLSELPIDPVILRSDRNLLESAISQFYVELFRPLGGDAQISISNDIVTVRWISESGVSAIVELSIDLLNRGDCGTAIPLLRSALHKKPDDPLVLFNLGMALSDVGRLDEAIIALESLVKLDPENARAWNALGVAYSRQNNSSEAESALRKSLQLDPNDGYAHRNLGALIVKRSHEEAVPYLKRAAELMPEDQAAQYGFGLALLETGDLNNADSALNTAIDINPLSVIAEGARTARTRLAHMNMRSAVDGGLRMDAVMYCLAALELFDKSPEKRQAVTFEIAMLGRSGLDINDSAQKYSLKSLPGRFSGFQLVSYMYVGLKQLSPDADPGIDLAREYGQARHLHGGSRA